MSGKNQTRITLGNSLNKPGISWQNTDPSIGFLPNDSTQGSAPSGVLGGVMTATNAIYSQIIEVSRMDNIGLEISWTGTPTGTLSVLVSNSGVNWPSLTFNPPLSQPAGSAGLMGIDLNQVPFKYFMLKYVNSSGSGVLNAYGQVKDLN